VSAATLPPEPADGTALYWPGDDHTLPALIIRDDNGALGGLSAEARWMAPNSADPWLTWAEALTVMAEQDCVLDQAVVLTVARPAPSDAEVEAAAQALAGSITEDLDDAEPWSEYDEDMRDAARSTARAALVAAIGARGGAS
jgi:hypothetical protein